MKLFCWIFILSVAIVSPIFLDLYPFSVFSMFSDNTSQYLVVQVTDDDGNELAPFQYGLHKVLRADRDQRYGVTLALCYFDKHDTLNSEEVNAFLAANFADESYPIVVRYWTRGFDETTKTIQNLTQPQEFRVDGVSLKNADNTQEDFRTQTHQVSVESGTNSIELMAKNRIGAIQ